MSKKEKFSIKKLFDLSPMGWYKVFGLSIKIGVAILIIFGAIGILNKFFPRQSDNINTPEIHIGSGGTAHYTVIQQQEEKRKWYVPTPFVEIFGQKTSDRDFDIGIRTGARWDF
jgi:hypothetical protein